MPPTLPRRMLVHHLPLFLASTAAVALLYVTRPYRDAISRASFATAYPALALLAFTLVPGSWNILRRRRNPVSTHLRRDIGIWAGILGIVHAAVGQCVHLRGRPWLYYVYAPREHKRFPIRHDLFGAANYTGAAATILLAALLATSSDLALRRLGTPRWKQLQRWNYAIFALTAIHTFAYQTQEKQHLPFVLTSVFCVAVALTFQLLGYSRRQVSAKARVAG